ncbi:MAG: PAS domain-containing protein, partial [Verrucomicrobiota bacterium]
MEPSPTEPRKRTGLLAYFRHNVFHSPQLILPLVLMAIFLVALIAMNVLHRIRVIPDDLDVLMDSILLAILLYPLLVFLVKRPYAHQITERMRSENALSESESRLRVLLESSPYFLAIRDANGVILMASKRLADYYGIAADRMIGVPQAELHRAAGLAQEDLEQIIASDREVIETGEPRFGLEKMAHPDGKVRWYRYSRLPVTMPS